MLPSKNLSTALLEVMVMIGMKMDKDFLAKDTICHVQSSGLLAGFDKY